MLAKTRKRAIDSRRGIAAVEVAVLAPCLVFLTLGMLELARGMMVKEILTDAARKGCRSAILPSAANSSITTDINTVLTNNNIPSAKATIQIKVNDVVADICTSTTGSKISVKVSVPVSAVAWVTPLFLPSADIESETVTMLSQKLP